MGGWQKHSRPHAWEQIAHLAVAPGKTFPAVSASSLRIYSLANQLWISRDSTTSSPSNKKMARMFSFTMEWTL